MESDKIGILAIKLGFVSFILALIYTWVFFRVGFGKINSVAFLPLLLGLYALMGMGHAYVVEDIGSLKKEILLTYMLSWLWIYPLLLSGYNSLPEFYHVNLAEELAKFALLTFLTLAYPIFGIKYKEI